MRAPYGPYGRSTHPAAQRQSVPLDTVLALRDQAEQAMAALRQSRNDLEASTHEAQALREALGASRAALEGAKEAQESLRRALDEAKSRAELAEARFEEAEVLARSEAEVQPQELDGAMEAAVISLRADLANVRRHQQDAVDRARREGRGQLLLPMLDTLDDLRRALHAADPAVAEGLRAMDRRLVQRLEAVGATVVDARGAFDPTLHEAIGTAPGPRDRIMEVVSHGLLDDGAVLRPARVLVGDGSRPPSPTPGGDL